LTLPFSKISPTSKKGEKMRNTTTLTLDSFHKQNEFISEIWMLLKKAYANVKGGLLFESKKELLEKTAQFKVVLHKNSVVAVTIYKAKRGLKLVAMATNNDFRDIAIPSLGKLIQNDLKTSWMEVSESAEKFVMRNGGNKFKIENSFAEKLLNKAIEPSIDGFHYTRNIANINKEKIILGTPMF
jgi:hypothetical protein